MRLRSLLFLLALGCGARTDLGGHVAVDGGGDAASPQLSGVVVNQCSPNDGLAMSFVISLDGFAPTCSLASGATVEITFWDPTPTTPGTYTIGDGSFSSGSIAVYCAPGNGPCVNATQGTLDLNELTAASASGSFSIVLPDSTTVTGSFEKAVLCNNSIMCG